MEPGPLCDIEDLEDTPLFDWYGLPDVSPPGAGKCFSDYEGNEYVAEIGYNPNKYLSHIMHIEITEYQVQNMNVNNLKDKLRKIKTSAWNKNTPNDFF